jgi:hypothetical protein
MIYTLSEYSRIKRVSVETIRRRIIKGIMPSTLKVKKLPGRCGAYLIEIVDRVKEIV